MWNNNYETALQDWIQLREDTKILHIEEALGLIHNFWQQVPTIPHYLHYDDHEEWPGPWELLAENDYCEVAKALGMLYTIILIDRPEVYSTHLLQDDNYTYTQVLTDEREYVLNDIPGSITTSLEDVCILHTLNGEYFKNKIL